MDEQLLIRFLTHTCTAADMRAINQWIISDRANADWLFEMERIWSLKDELRFSDKKEIERAYNKFLTSCSSSQKSLAIRFSIPIGFGWIKYVAAILILVLSGLYFYSNQQEELMYQEIEIPTGQYISLTLSDGTKVWLNAESKLKYPTRFSKKERIVCLEGEAFFEVAPNKEVPFIVESSQLQVKVLGTKFNFKAFNEEESIVSLVEGKVEVESLNHARQLLLPGQQLSFSKEHGMRLVSNLDTKQMGRWTQGEIYFKNSSLEDICRALERKFNVDIIIRDETLKREKYTCHVQGHSTVEEVFSLLKKTRVLDYTKENGKILIFKSK